MKLLFDENLSPELVRLLADLFPESVHVRDVGLKAADDLLVWQYAKDNRLIIRLEGLGSASAQLHVWASTEAHMGSIGELLNSGRGKTVTSNVRCDHHFLRKQ